MTKIKKWKKPLLTILIIVIAIVELFRVRDEGGGGTGSHWPREDIEGSEYESINFLLEDAWADHYVCQLVASGTLTLKSGKIRMYVQDDAGNVMDSWEYTEPGTYEFERKMKANGKRAYAFGAEGLDEHQELDFTYFIEDYYTWWGQIFR